MVISAERRKPLLSRTGSSPQKPINGWLVEKKVAVPYCTVTEKRKLTVVESAPEVAFTAGK